MSTAIYLRVSSKGQKLASQKREIERYLTGHDITEARWFVDTISTRKDITKRPGLTELRRAIFDGQIDTVILYRLDRLARSIREGINLLTDWINAGVRIVITTMQIDLSGALGQTVAALLLGLAQMEREAIRDVKRPVSLRGGIVWSRKVKPIPAVAPPARTRSIRSGLWTSARVG